MLCTQCGNEVEQQARFCSKCGHELAPAQMSPRQQHDMTMHVNVLGWLYIGTGVLVGMLGLVIIFASQLITRMPIPWPQEVPAGIVPFVGSIVVIAGLATMALAGAVAAAGIGLLQYTNWGRVLAVITAAFLALKFPIGTAIAIYTFWVLFSAEGRDHYKTRSALAQT
jgi:zinc-ribbon domain